MNPDDVYPIVESRMRETLCFHRAQKRLVFGIDVLCRHIPRYISIESALELKRQVSVKQRAIKRLILRSIAKYMSWLLLCAALRD